VNGAVAGDWTAEGRLDRIPALGGADAAAVDVDGGERDPPFSDVAMPAAPPLAVDPSPRAVALPKFAGTLSLLSGARTTRVPSASLIFARWPRLAVYSRIATGGDDSVVADVERLCCHMKMLEPAKRIAAAAAACSA
jgi:hypothetical protein